MNELTPKEVFKALHTQSDGRINFTRNGGKEGDEWEQIASVTAGDIGALWPQIAPFMGVNGYFSINSFSMPSKATGPAGLPQAAGRKPNVQYLNSHWVDIDCGRKSKSGPGSQTPQEAMYDVQEKCYEMGIPTPGLWALSGRGIYVFWPFETPLQQWPNSLKAFETVQKELLQVHKASDPRPVNANRVLRVPNTKHSVSRKHCRYYYSHPEGLIRTDPNELYEGLKIIERPRQWFVTQKPGSAPKRKAGSIAVYRRRANDIAALHKSRDGLKKGMRLYGLAAYAAARLHCGDNECEVRESVQTMADECQPPYPSDKKDATIGGVMSHAKQQVKERRVTRTATIIARLQITPEEMAQCQLITLNSIVAQTAQTTRETRRENEGRPNRTKHQEFVDSYLSAKPTASVREVFAAAAAANIKASRGTIHADIKANRDTVEHHTQGR